MEDTGRALQQQVKALTAQNAALEAQLRGQQNIAQGLLPGAITSVLSRLRELVQAARKVEPEHSGTSTKSLEGDSVAYTSEIA